MNDFTKNEDQINRILGAFNLKIEKHCGSDNEEEIYFGLYGKDQFLGNMHFDCEGVDEIKALNEDRVYKNYDFIYKLGTTQEGSIMVPERRIILKNNIGNIELVFKTIPKDNGKSIVSFAIELYNSHKELTKTTFYEGTDGSSIILEKDCDKEGNFKDKYAKRGAHCMKDENLGDGAIATYHEFGGRRNVVRYSLLRTHSVNDPLELKAQVPYSYGKPSEYKIPVRGMNEKTAISKMFDTNRAKETIDVALSNMRAYIPNFNDILKFPEFEQLNELMIERKYDFYNTNNFLPDDYIEECNFNNGNAKKIS